MAGGAPTTPNRNPRREDLGFDAHLVVEKGDHVGKRLSLGGGTATLGRSSKCELPLPGSGGVSRRHCKIQLVGDRFVVIDLESRNGTIVNGARVERAFLRDGDLLEVGDEHVRFRMLVRTPAPAQGSSTQGNEAQGNDAQGPSAQAQSAPAQSAQARRVGATHEPQRAERPERAPETPRGLESAGADREHGERAGRDGARAKGGKAARGETSGKMSRRESSGKVGRAPRAARAPEPAAHSDHVARDEGPALAINDRPTALVDPGSPVALAAAAHVDRSAAPVPVDVIPPPPTATHVVDATPFVQETREERERQLRSTAEARVRKSEAAPEDSLPEVSAIALEPVDHSNRTVTGLIAVGVVLIVSFGLAVWDLGFGDRILLSLLQGNTARQKVDEQKVDERKVDAQKAGEQKAVEQKVDEQNVDEQNVDEQNVDEQNVDEQNVDEQKPVEPKPVEPKFDEPRGTNAALAQDERAKKTAEPRGDEAKAETSADAKVALAKNADDKPPSRAANNVDASAAAKADEAERASAGSAPSARADGAASGTANTAPRTTTVPSSSGGGSAVVSATAAGRVGSLRVKVGDRIVAGATVLLLEGSGGRRKLEALREEERDFAAAAASGDKIAQRDLEAVREEVAELERRARPQPIASEKGGVVREVLVGPGDVVKQGQPVVILQ